MATLIAGIVVFAITAIVFCMLLPRHGKYHRFVGTEMEPYVSVGITAGIALAMTMTLSGVIGLLGSP